MVAVLFLYSIGEVSAFTSTVTSLNMVCDTPTDRSNTSKPYLKPALIDWEPLLIENVDVDVEPLPSSWLYEIEPDIVLLNFRAKPIEYLVESEKSDETAAAVSIEAELTGLLVVTPTLT